MAEPARLERLERERDERVRRVLAQADQRKARREQALRRLVQARPEAPQGPQGLGATLQRKGHQQALLAWETAKEAAAKLVEQAKRLAARLLEAAKPERLAAWAREHLQHGQPGRGVSDRAPAALAKQPQPPQPPQPPQLSRHAKLPDVSRYSIEDQYRLYSQIVGQLKAAGQEKVQRLAAKGAKRLERRQAQATWSEADRPQKPRGLLAAFKKSEYDQAVKAYWQRQRRDRLLVEQAAKLQKKVLEATHRSENWAVRKLRSLQPEFTQRVERYVDGYNLQVQVAELEAGRKLQQERGIE